MNFFLFFSFIGSSNHRLADRTDRRIEMHARTTARSHIAHKYSFAGDVFKKGDRLDNAPYTYFHVRDYFVYTVIVVAWTVIHADHITLC